MEELWKRGISSSSPFNATDEEVNPMQCAHNLRMRMNYINKTYFEPTPVIFEGWLCCDEHRQDRETLCLCGHKITHVYHVFKGDLTVQVGSSCIKRFGSPEMISSYNKVNRTTLDCRTPECNERIPKNLNRLYCDKCTETTWECISTNCMNRTHHRHQLRCDNCTNYKSMFRVVM